MNKAKQILYGEARKLRSKASQKRREADRLEVQAVEMEKQANGMS